MTVHLKPYWGKPAVRNFRGGRGNPKLVRARRAPLPYSADEFVRKTIEQIISGVGKAGKFAEENGGTITERSTKVEFDVAVTVAEGKEANAGAGISIAGIINVGAKGKTDSTNSTVSRIRFEVGVTLPGKAKEKVSMGELQRKARQR